MCTQSKGTCQWVLTWHFTPVEIEKICKYSTSTLRCVLECKYVATK